MKLTIAMAAFGALAISSPTWAHDTKEATTEPVKHSGGTDANGCHTNHQTGDYHCHNPK